MHCDWGHSSLLLTGGELSSVSRDLEPLRGSGDPEPLPRELISGVELLAESEACRHRSPWAKGLSRFAFDFAANLHSWLAPMVWGPLGLQWDPASRLWMGTQQLPGRAHGGQPPRLGSASA